MAPTAAMAATMSYDDHELQQQRGGFRAPGINIINPAPNWDMITPFSDDSPAGSTDRKYSGGKIKAAESKYACAGSPAERGRNGKKATAADWDTAVAAAADLKQKQNQNQSQNNNNSNSKGSESTDHDIHIWTERERRKKMRNMFSTLHALLPHLPAKADKSTIVDEAVNYIKSLQHSLEKLEKQRQEMNVVKKNVMMSADQRRSVDEVVVVPAAVATEYSREAYMADFKGNCCKNWAPPPVSSQLLPRTGHIPDQYMNYCGNFHTWSSPNVVLSVAGDDAHISLCASTKPGLLPTIFYILEKHTLQLITAHISSDYFRTMYMIHVRAINGVSDHLTEAASVEEIFKLAVGEIILWLSP